MRMDNRFRSAFGIYLFINPEQAVLILHYFVIFVKKT